MGWNKIKEWLHYNFSSVATKQHAASILIDQQQKPTEALQECIQIFSDLLLKSSGLLLYQAKDLAHITHFIHKFHNQKLKHYVLGKNPTSAQNAITIVQKKDTEFCIIEDLHNHDSEQKINNISTSNIKIRIVIQDHAMVVTANTLKDCEDSLCKRCKPNLDNHAPARCSRKRPPNRQQWFNPYYNNNPTRNNPNSHNDPNLQLSISTSKPDHIAET